MTMFCRILVLTGCILFLLVQLSNAEDALRDAVVKVHVTQRPPDFVRPWTKGRPRESSGSGVIIDGNRILTNAHVVLYASLVHVQAYQSSKRELAEVIAVAPEVDLALITVKDKSFFENRKTLPLEAQIPQLKETINVYGYPMGGEQLSITEGIISRIEYTQIAFSQVGLRLQIDAALNPGNSGGPAIVADKVVGLAYSTIRDADNIGYVIGTEEIERFLNHIPNGKYESKPAMYDEVQSVENEALRDWLKLGSDQGGLLITKPYSTDDDYPLKLNDVITKLGDFEIDRKGYVQVADDLKLSFRYLIPRLATKNDDDVNVVPANVYRNGETHEVKIPVVSKRDLLIPSLEGEYPSYFIHGPVLFTTPSQELLRAIRVALPSLAALESPLAIRTLDKPGFDGEELVILGGRLFTHATSEGYENTAFGVVTHINGTKVQNLVHVAKTLRNIEDEFVRLNLIGAGTRHLAFNRQEMLDASEQILEDEGIRIPFSKDLNDAISE